MSDLVGNLEGRFSHNEAYILLDLNEVVLMNTYNLYLSKNKKKSQFLSENYHFCSLKKSSILQRHVNVINL